MRECRLLPISLRPQASAGTGSLVRERRRTGRVASALAVARVALVTLLPLTPLTGCAGSATGPAPGAPPGPGSGTTPEPTWTLAWQDEFDGPAGATFDPTKWVAETGGGGFGNHELEFYTKDTANVALDGQGHLVITARAESPTTSNTCWYGRCRYTSARLKTQGTFAQAYGRFEARIRVPRGQGVWPAFWMLGSDIDKVGWPQSGEIDVMENIGREPAIVHGTVHGPGYSGGNGIGNAFTLSSGAFADDFHVFAVEWTPVYIRWLVDGNAYHGVTASSIPSSTRWVFDHPFFLLLNFAVGGDWPGSPDASTTFPQQMVVDYVRVYRGS